MSRRLLLTAAAAAAIVGAWPATAAAQRGGGSQAARHVDLFDKEATPQGPQLRVRDIEDLNPIKLLIDKRKDLKLTDAQLAQLKDAEPKLKTANESNYKAVDSLVHALRPGTPTDQEKARLRDARMALMTAIGAVRASYDSAAKDATALLDADQQAKATELLAKQRDEGERTLREKLGGGRGREGGDR